MQKSDNKTLWQNPAKQQSAIASFAELLGLENEPDILHEFSLTQPKKFWGQLWDFLDIIGEKGREITKPAKHLIDFRFFADAKINYAQNLLRGEDKKTAIIAYDESNNQREIDFANLRSQVSKIASALKSEGIKSGDIIAGIVPNSIEAIAIHLAAASIGAVWASCSPDFGVDSIVDRLGQIKPKLLFCANGYSYAGKRFSLKEKMSQVQAKIPSIKRTIIFPFGENNVKQNNFELGISLEKWLAPHEEAIFAPKPLPFNHPLVVLFSSGTTGKPKCLIHSAGGLLLNHMKEQQLHGDIGQDDRLFYFTTCGWMMWNWQLSALASGASLVLFDGNPFYPSPLTLFNLIATEKVTHFGTSARYIDACLKEGIKPKDKCNISSLKTVFSTGSPLSPAGFDWIYENVGQVHLASISGGTDICACFVGGNPLKPVIRGQIQGAMLGLDVDVVDDQGNSTINQAGELVCKNAHPSMPLGFWGDKDNKLYKHAYFAKFNNIWAQGDWAIKYDNGNYVILGRSDATLNPGGVRIGSSEIYRQTAKIPEIIESVAIGKQVEGDVEIWLFVKLQENISLNKQLEKTIKQAIRIGASPRHVPKKIFSVPDIPITRSGKISEIAVRDILHGRAVKNKSALANEEALEYFKNFV